MNRPGLTTGLLCLLAGLVFFANLGGPHLFDEDEPRNAACTAEMLERGNLIVPVFNGELRDHKPALLYWLMASAYAVFGVSEFAARFWSAVLAVGTVLCTYQLGRLLLEGRTGFWAAIMLCGSPMFVAVGRAATPESLLVFLLTLAMLVYVAWVKRQGRGFQSETLPKAFDTQDGRLRFLPTGVLAWITIYSVMALAVLAKGPVGVVLPAATVGLFVMAVQYFDRLRTTTPTAAEPRTILGRCGWLLGNLRLGDFGRALIAMRPLTGLLVGAVLAAPWYVAVSWMTDGAWLAGFLGDHNLGRFTRPMENHNGPPFYYILAILAGSFPWSVILPLAVFSCLRQMQAGSPRQAALMLLTIWSVFHVGLYTLASTKLPHYVLSAYPALALLTAHFATGWVQAAVPAYRRMMQLGAATLTTVGVLVAVGLGVAAHLLLPGQEWLACVGLVPLLGGLAMSWFVKHDRRPAALATLGVTGIVFMLGIFPWGSAQLNAFQNSERIARVAGAPDNGAAELAGFRYYRSTLTFYARNRVPTLHSGEEIARFWHEQPNGAIVLRSDDLPDFETLVGGPYETVLRERRFLGKDEILVVRRPPELAQRKQNHGSLPDTSDKF